MTRSQAELATDVLLHDLVPALLRACPDPRDRIAVSLGYWSV